jgi:hypothetical protein
VGSCEHGNGHSSSIKDAQCLPVSAVISSKKDFFHFGVIIKFHGILLTEITGKSLRDNLTDGAVRSTLLQEGASLSKLCMHFIFRDHVRCMRGTPSSQNHSVCRMRSSYIHVFFQFSSQNE